MLINTREVNQDDNDIYFIETVSNKIIVNDDYSGILIFNNNLELIKKLKLFDDITIYSSFINNINEGILMFCPDNECMIYVNLLTYEYKVIYLKNGLESLIFSTLYEWNENGLALSTYNGEFYDVCVNKNTIRKIEYMEVEKLYPKLAKFYNESINNKVIKEVLGKYIAVIDDERHNINIINCKEQIEYVLNNVTSNFIDMDFKDGIFVVVNEDYIEIFANKNNEELCTSKNYIFLKARLVNKPNSIYIVTISSNKSSVKHCKINMFQLCML